MQLSLYVNLSLGNITSQIRDGMGDVCKGTSQQSVHLVIEYDRVTSLLAPHMYRSEIYLLLYKDTGMTCAELGHKPLAHSNIRWAEVYGQTDRQYPWTQNLTTARVLRHLISYGEGVVIAGYFI